MVRDVKNRYHGLPQRTPELLFSIVRKFYRGAVSHYDLIQERKVDVARALETMRRTGDRKPLAGALTTLFLEFHLYVTCWLQIELALYRLARIEETSRLGEVMDRFRLEIETHLQVRDSVDATDACVQAQFDHFGEAMSCVEKDAYWFEGIYFSVDRDSLDALHRLYDAIMQAKNA
jgi:hypothetical protein